MFTLYPAIDLLGGRCVMLKQGDYDRETVYGTNPVDMAKRWEEEGAEWLHIVDLDAARTGEPVNLSAIQQIVDAVRIPVQVGGGIRQQGRANELFALGVDRLILGSATIENMSFVKEMLATHADRIAIGIDARDGYVATHGWLQTSQVKAEVLAEELAREGAKTFIFTDISRDGTLSGPNVEAIRKLAGASGRKVIASGGVSHLDDITRLAKHTEEGISGAIIGSALYTGDVKLDEALRQLQDGRR